MDPVPPPDVSGTKDALWQFLEIDRA